MKQSLTRLAALLLSCSVESNYTPNYPLVQYNPINGSDKK